MGKKIKMPKITLPKKLNPLDVIAPVAQIGNALLKPLFGGSGGGGGSAGAPAPVATQGDQPTAPDTRQSWQVPGDPNWQGTAPTNPVVNPYSAPRVDPRRSVLRNRTIDTQNRNYQFQPRFNNIRTYLGNVQQPAQQTPAQQAPVQQTQQPQPTQPPQTTPQSPVSQPRPAPQVLPAPAAPDMSDPRMALAMQRMNANRSI